MEFSRPEGIGSHPPSQGSLSLLQGIFPTQGSNPGSPHCLSPGSGVGWGGGAVILYQLSHKVKVKVAQLCRLFATPWTIQSTEFSRPEYWSG